MPHASLAVHMQMDAHAAASTHQTVAYCSCISALCQQSWEEVKDAHPMGIAPAGNKQITHGIGQQSTIPLMTGDCSPLQRSKADAICVCEAPQSTMQGRYLLETGNPA
jgi:hypothetical protein